MSEAFEWVVGIAAVIVSLAVLGQFAMLAAMYRAVKEAQKAGREAGTKLGPMVDRIDALITVTGKILDENSPRISHITGETLHIVQAARQHADRIGELIDETNGRAKARIAQIDETVDRTVQQVEQASESVKSAVLKPVKEVNGLVAGVKAAVQVYAQGGNRNSPEHATQDEAMFI